MSELLVATILLEGTAGSSALHKAILGRLIGWMLAAARYPVPSDIVVFAPLWLTSSVPEYEYWVFYVVSLL